MKIFTKLIILCFLLSFLLLFGVYFYKQKLIMGGPALAREGGIISLQPAVTEILFEIGAGDDVVAVSTFCNYPPAVKKLPKVGDSFSADMEAIVTLDPSAVYIGENSPELEARLEDLDIPTVIVPDAQSVPDIYFNITLIAMTQGKDADKLIASLQKAAGAKPSVKYRAFIEIDDGLWTAGSQSFISDLVEYAGLENIYKDVASGYFQVSLEDILKRNPDIIINIKTAFKRNNPLPKELQNKKAIALDPDIYARPAPRAIRGISHLKGKVNEIR